MVDRLPAAAEGSEEQGEGRGAKAGGGALQARVRTRVGEAGPGGAGEPLPDVRSSAGLAGADVGLAWTAISQSVLIHALALHPVRHGWIGSRGWGGGAA